MTTEELVSAIVDKMEEDKLLSADIVKLIQTEKERRELNGETEEFRYIFDKLSKYLESSNVEKNYPMYYTKNTVIALSLLKEKKFNDPEDYIVSLSERINTSERKIKASIFGDYQFEIWRGLKELVSSKGKYGIGKLAWDSMSRDEKYNYLRGVAKTL